MSMNVFELFAKLGLDTSEYDKGLDNAAAEGKSFGSKLTSAFGAAAKGATVAIGAAATAVTGLATASVSGYKEYEQLVGGVETLFGAGGKSLEEFVREEVAAGKTAEEATSLYNGLMQAQQNVFDNAKNAYKEAGMSANEYMENVSSFAAALVDSAGRGDQVDVDEMKEQQKEELRQFKRSQQDKYDAEKEAWDARIKLVDSKNKEQKEMLRQQKADELKALKRAQEDELVAYKASQEDLRKETEAANSASEKTPESMIRASELADQAMKDISDNVNKMGSSMESVQNAYQGFAKQNYTMLDNLKLGYGGTKEEMERLLANAEKLTGKDFSISKFSDVVEAIHAIQVEMGITGTTSKEAAQTISGSMGQLKAAWENLVVGFADKDADLGGLIGDVVDSAEGAFNNMLPVVENALAGIADFVEKISPIIADRLPGVIEKLLPAILNAAQGLLKAVFGALPALISTIVSQIPSLANAAVELMTIIVTGISDSLPTLIPALTKAMLEVVLMLTDPQTILAFTNAGIQLTLGILNGITEAAPQIIEALPVIMQNISDAMIQSAPLIMDAVVQIFNILIETLPTWLVMIMDLMPLFMKQITEALIAEAPVLVKGVASMVGILIANLPKILMSLVSPVKNLLLSYLMIGSELSSAFEGDLGSAISKTGESIKTKISGIFSGLLDAVLAPHKAAWEKLTEVVTPVFDKIGSQVNAGINTIKGIIKAAGTLLLIPWQFIWKNFGEDVVGAFKLMGDDIDSALTDLAGRIDSTLTPKIEAIQTAFVSFCDDTKGAFDLWGQDIDEGLTAFAGKVDEYFTPKIDAMKEGISGMVEDTGGALTLWKDDIDNAFITFAGLVDETFAPAIETIKSVWADMCDSLDNKFTEVAGKLDETWQNIKKAVEDAFAWLEETFVLPHISVEGEWDLKAGKIPEFKVEWFDKAMDNAMVLNGATIFGASGGRLLGGGESGAEVVSGASTLMSMINQAVSAGSPQQMTVILELDKTQLAKTVYQLNNSETQRVGMRLVNV